MLGLAAAGLLAGSWLKRRLRVLDRLNVPAPVIGGLLLSALLTFVDRRVETMPRDVLMIAFFTTVGLSASVRLIRRSGAQVIVFLALASAGAVLQNLLGIALMSLFGLPPAAGILVGAAALAGGPATSLAFGPLIEKAGVPGATGIAMASAMFGIATAGLLAGHLGGRLIRAQNAAQSRDRQGAVFGASKNAAQPESPLAMNVLAILIAMGIGSLISLGIERAGALLPAYIGAMIAAAGVRNLDDRFGLARLSEARIAELGNVALALFIVMALITLDWAGLVALALVMALVLVAQVALAWVLSVAVCFRAMGRDYEAAVMSAGFLGFMLGVTANALASMDELARKHGPAPRAFIVVPLVGGFLIDFTNALIITVTLNWLR